VSPHLKKTRGCAGSRQGAVHGELRVSALVLSCSAKVKSVMARFIYFVAFVGIAIFPAHGQAKQYKPLRNLPSPQQPK
jgi:hypothetical protein